jgi:hypothetical protein
MTDTPQGWRANKVHSGCLIDVQSGQTVARGFAMPHSPRVHRGRVWMLHSGAGQLVLVDPASGKAETVTELPGYTRGLALYPFESQHSLGYGYVHYGATVYTDIVVSPGQGGTTLPVGMRDKVHARQRGVQSGERGGC